LRSLSTGSAPLPLNRSHTHTKGTGPTKGTHTKGTHPKRGAVVGSKAGGKFALSRRVEERDRSNFEARRLRYPIFHYWNCSESFQGSVKDDGAKSDGKEVEKFEVCSTY
jgi:hypothetical protein